MKIKIKSLSLTLFVLLQICLVTTLEDKSSINKNTIMKPVKVNQEKEEKTDKSIIKKKETKISQNSVNISPNKTEDTSNSQTKNETNSQSQSTRISSSKPKKDGFFTKTRKENKSIAAEALGAFISGIVLFICSIYLICWNERRAVKEAEFTDFIRQEKKSVVLEDGKEVTKEDEKKVVIVNGAVTVQEEAKIDELPLEIKTPKGKILVIKTHFEYFSERQVESEKEVGEDSEGNTLMRKETVTHRNWHNTNYGNNSKFSTKFYHGKVLISNKYRANLENLNSEVEFKQTHHLADNSFIYRPSQSDIPILEEYFKSENFDSSRPFKIIVKDPWIYIIRSNASIEDLNPDTYKFDPADIRLTIKYFYIPNQNTEFTAAGALGPMQEDGTRDILPYRTDLNKAGCSYFCCCCAESDEKYEVNLLYTCRMSRDQIVSDLEIKNQACTLCLRICGFLMHFAGYYLILYPLITLVGMIPWIGAVGATLLVLFAFIMSLITFLFIIAVAWVVARPLLAFVIFGIIFLLIFIGKTTRDHFEQEKNSNNGSNWQHREGPKFLAI